MLVLDPLSRFALETSSALILTPAVVELAAGRRVAAFDRACPTC